MTNIFVGDNDHGDAVPPIDVLLQMTKQLRVERDEARLEQCLSPHTPHIEYEPIDYRLRCHSKRTDLPADVLRDIGEAYAEINRLNREFDGLVVGPGEAEALVCSCDHPAIEAWKNSEEAQKMQEEQDARMEKMLKEMSQTDPLEFFEKKLDNDSESD